MINHAQKLLALFHQCVIYIEYLINDIHIGNQCKVFFVGFRVNLHGKNKSLVLAQAV